MKFVKLSFTPSLFFNKKKRISLSQFNQSPLKMALFLYAFDDSQNLVKIQDAAKMESKFFCPYCHEEMIRRMGKKREWHFAHKFAHNREKCSYNNDLHTLAERKIMEWWNSGEEIKIALQYKEICPCSRDCFSYNGNICVRNITRIINLNTIFGYCELEKEFKTKEGEKFRADIFCHNKEDENDPLFLEVDVSNECKDKKIHSGIRIIEFVIKSEEDIDAIIGKTIAEGEKVRYYNIKEKEKRTNKTDCLKAFCDKYETKKGKASPTINNGVHPQRTPKITTPKVKHQLPPGLQQSCSICIFRNQLPGRICLASRERKRKPNENNDGKDCPVFSWKESKL